MTKDVFCRSMYIEVERKDLVMDEYDYGQCDFCGEDNDISGHCVDSFCEYYAGTPEHDALIEEFGEDMNDA